MFLLDIKSFSLRSPSTLFLNFFDNMFLFFILFSPFPCVCFVSLRCRTIFFRQRFHSCVLHVVYKFGRHSSDFFLAKRCLFTTISIFLIEINWTFVGNYCNVEPDELLYLSLEMKNIIFTLLCVFLTILINFKVNFFGI